MTQPIMVHCTPVEIPPLRPLTVTKAKVATATTEKVISRPLSEID